jgi:hypothetical protein
MNAWKAATLIAAGFAMGCMTASPPLTAQSPPGGEAAGGECETLVLDRADFRIGTTVQFDRMPNAGDLNDLRLERGLAHVVLDLDRWPEDITQVAPLDQVPPESDVIVLLRGYPPSRAAAELWNYAGGRTRVVLLVNGPPQLGFSVDVLNQMRTLERVIVQTDQPSRGGFEQLQRPLSFRKLVRG